MITVFAAAVVVVPCIMLYVFVRALVHYCLTASRFITLSEYTSGFLVFTGLCFLGTGATSCVFFGTALVESNTEYLLASILGIGISACFGASVVNLLKVYLVWREASILEFQERDKEVYLEGRNAALSEIWASMTTKLSNENLN